MKYFQDLKIVLIVVLAAILFFTQFKSCDNTPTGPVIIREVDTVYQEVKIEVPKYVPKYITKIVEKRIEVKVPADVDTAAILEDYYSKYKVIDTVSLPYSTTDTTSFGYGIITDIITQNKIAERGIVWNYSIPTIKETITIYPAPKNQLYFGANTAINTVQLVNNVSTGLILKNKKDRIYQLNLGLVNTGNGVTPFVGGGMYWKIKLKKDKILEAATDIGN